jgi:hypothetical protein
MGGLRDRLRQSQLALARHAPTAYDQPTLTFKSGLHHKAGSGV